MSPTERVLTWLGAAALCLSHQVHARGDGPPRPVTIGVVADAEGALLAGARAAAAEVNAGGGVRGRPLRLVYLPPARPWADGPGRLARLVFDEDVVALVGPVDPIGAHVAGQIGTRSRIPVITLSSEDSLTRAGVPWILRGVPSDVAQARAGLERSLAAPRGARAAIAVPGGRDGRERRASLLEACRDLGVQVASGLEAGAPVAVRDDVDVLLLWLDAAPAAELLARPGRRRYPVVASLRLADGSAAGGAAGPVVLPELREPAGAPPAEPCGGAPRRLSGAALRESGLAARLAYDMVWAASAAARRGGADPEPILHELLSGCSIAGLSGRFHFDGEGNRRGSLTVSASKRPR